MLCCIYPYIHIDAYMSYISYISCNSHLVGRRNKNLITGIIQINNSTTKIILQWKHTGKINWNSPLCNRIFVSHSVHFLMSPKHLHNITMRTIWRFSGKVDRCMYDFSSSECPMNVKNEYPSTEAPDPEDFFGILKIKYFSIFLNIFILFYWRYPYNTVITTFKSPRNKLKLMWKK